MQSVGATITPVPPVAVGGPLPSDFYHTSLSGLVLAAESGVGDINSTAKGSGARYNSGKAPLELIPLRIIADQWVRANLSQHLPKEVFALRHIAMFQEGRDSDTPNTDADHLLDALSCLDIKWEDCAAVFDYGRKKYAEWNWAKGMAWSIPIACAARHILFGLLRGEENDPESGLPHRGHVACNIVMLLTYLRTFPEGDDRPKGLLG